MVSALKPEWSKPRTILFATELPANDKAFGYAVAQAQQSAADLVLFHAYDTLVVSGPDTTGTRYFDYAAAARSEMNHLEPMAEHARAAGLKCEVVVRPGLPADQILAYTREHAIDRIVMGTHSPGPVGKLLVGSVAEAVLRNATVPVYIIGPNVVDGKLRHYSTRTILCAVSMMEGSQVVARFAAEIAAQQGARLILQNVIRPQERREVLAGRSIDQIEADLLALIPEELQQQVDLQAIVVPGDPTEELLYQSRAQDADLVVLGAHGASAFAAITRNGIVYKVLAQAHSPVMTLSPAVLIAAGVPADQASSAESFLAGIV